MLWQSNFYMHVACGFSCGTLHGQSDESIITRWLGVGTPPKLNYHLLIITKSDDEKILYACFDD